MGCQLSYFNNAEVVITLDSKRRELQKRRILRERRLTLGSGDAKNYGSEYDC